MLIETKDWAMNTTTIPIQSDSSQDFGLEIESSGLERDENLARIEIATLALIFLTTVVGNATVLLALWTRKRFESCLSLSNSKGCPPSITDGLDLYGLLKQATKGDIHKAKPSMLNVVERAKWEAWYKRKGLSRDEAMENFIEKVRSAYSCSC